VPQKGIAIYKDKNSIYIIAIYNDKNSGFIEQMCIFEHHGMAKTKQN
jgi:hypothetical protein